MGYGGMVNHTDNPLQKNCEITHIGGDVYYVFEKDVEKDEEILAQVLMYLEEPRDNH